MNQFTVIPKNGAFMLLADRSTTISPMAARLLREDTEVEMDHDEWVAERVAELTDAERGELWRLCEARRQREDRGGAGEVPHYETGSPAEIAEVLHAKGLVHRLGSLTAATHLVYGYYQRNGIGVSAG